MTNHWAKITIYVGWWRATWNSLVDCMRPAGCGLDSIVLENDQVLLAHPHRG